MSTHFAPVPSWQADRMAPVDVRQDHGLPDNREREPEFLLICGNAGLRGAIRKNLVTFPAQMVRLRSSGHGNDRPERIVQLYFVHGWSIGKLCHRYRLSKKRVEDVLMKWRHRAVAAGFVQEIQPRGLPKDRAQVTTGERPEFFDARVSNLSTEPDPVVRR
jgi:hypothetical protein